MNFRHVFPDKAYDLVRDYYSYHESPHNFVTFNQILDEQYFPGLGWHKRNFSYIKSPTENLIEKLENRLNRCSWVMYDEKTVKSVLPGEFGFNYIEYPLEIISDDFTEIHGYPVNSHHFHILLAKSKKPSLCNFRRFKRAFEILLKRYAAISAYCAVGEDKIIGTGQNWRFEKCGNSTRLLKYWHQCGFKSMDGDPFRIVMEK